MTLNGNPKGRTTKNWAFLCRQSFTLPKIYLVWRSSALFLSLIGNYSVFLRSFPFYFLPIFDRESFFSFLFIFSFSFFSFLPFLTFHFSFSISFFGKSGFCIRYLLSFEEILLSFSSGKGWGLFSWAKVQSSLRLYLNMVFSSREPDFDIWSKTNSRLKVSVSGWISILFPRGACNNDDLETTCKISHGHS